jgi:hypothetical protein
MKTKVRSQPRQKVSEIPFQEISQAWWFMAVNPAIWEA